jgi:copper chaperone CopZ
VSDGFQSSRHHSKMSLRGTTPRVVLATSLGLLAGYSTYRYRVSRRAPIESHPSGRSAPGPLSCQCRQWTDLLSLQTSWQLTTPFRYAAVSHQNLTLSDREHDETCGNQTLFAVPLSCDGCVKAVSDQLYKLGGITKVEGNLKDQLISVEGSGKICTRQGKTRALFPLC